MKRLLSIIFSIVSFFVISQNINDLEKRKSELNSSKTLFEQSKINNEKYYDSIFTRIELEKKNLELVKVQLTISQDSLNNLIEPFGISESNLKMYYLLKNEKIIDPNSKNYNNYCKILNKAFNFSKGQEFFVIAEFICLKKFDNNGKISSFEKIKLSSVQIEKQNKLLSKKSISLLSENNLILENLTGVNSKYLFLNEQLSVINDKMKTLNSELISLSERKENIHLEFTQKKNNIEHEIEGITNLISEIDLQIIQINEQIALENAKTLNYSKFKTKKINGIEVCTAPLSVREFRNGDEIKKARTEGEWKKFNELKIPAYHFKDFDDNQANYGFIYNYYAITDNRELAPFGFHKLNLIDFNYLENQLLFTDSKLVNCYCGDGTEGTYESCTNCNYWTETQRKYNVCSKCKNRRYFKMGTKICSSCNGTKKIKAFNLEDRKFCVFPSSTNNVEFENSLDFFNSAGFILGEYGDHNLLGVLEVDDQGKCHLTNYSTKNIKNYQSASEISYKEQEFQVLICKDDREEYFDNFQYSQIGDVEIMNTFLNVTKFRNGDPIKYIEDPVEWELALKNKIPAYCYFNNIDDGTGCIYNVHAYNDKRGLIPKGWDEITYKDLVNMSFVLNYSFSLTSAYSPVSPPQGIRLTDGTFKELRYDKSSYSYRAYEGLNFFIEENYSHYTLKPYNGYEKKPQSGYILCTRNAQIPYNIKNKIQNRLDKSNLLSKTLLSNSKLIDWEQEYFTSLGKSGDYLNIYNDSGIAVIHYLVKSNFNDLFDKNGELRIICMDYVQLHCEKIYCCGYTEYLHDEHNDSGRITGLIIKKSNDEKEPLIGTAIIAYTEGSGFKREISKIESMSLVRKDELIFNFDGKEVSFCFSRNKCAPSDNPLDNFYILFDGQFGIDSKWYSQVKGEYWDRNEEWALEQVLEFMNNH